MAASNSKSHLGFFIALLVVVAVGALGYWGYVMYAEPIAEQKQTAEANPGRPHPPKDKMPAKPGEGTAGKPAANAGTPTNDK